MISHLPKKSFMRQIMCETWKSTKASEQEKKFNRCSHPLQIAINFIQGPFTHILTFNQYNHLVSQIIRDIIKQTGAKDETENTPSTLPQIYALNSTQKAQQSVADHFTWEQTSH